jgi:hypothetical protein
VPQACVALGWHSPCPEQLDQLDQAPVALLQVRDCEPQLPQACELSPTHTWLPQLPHSHSMLQVCVPELPQAWVSLGSQVPCPVQSDQEDQMPLSQARLCVPQRPQLSLAGPVQL